MSYKVAVASSDKKKIDVSFGKAQELYIYGVDEDNQIQLLETRPLKQDNGGDCRNEGGHQGQEGHLARLQAVLDCRCVLCKEFGFQIRRILEKNGILIFDVEYDIDEALEKIARYLGKAEHHKHEPDNEKVKHFSGVT